MANPSYGKRTTAGDLTFYPDTMQSPFNLSYAVELASGATASYTVSYTLDDPNDASWTVIWLPDPTNGSAQTASSGGYYSFPIRGIKVTFASLSGAAARLAVIQGLSAR